MQAVDSGKREFEQATQERELASIAAEETRRAHAHALERLHAADRALSSAQQTMYERLTRAAEVFKRPRLT